MLVPIDVQNKTKLFTRTALETPQYTPLIECLHGEVQNPVHILHEANQKDWVRGGYPSRQWVHQQKFNKQCPQRGGVNTV